MPLASRERWRIGGRADDWPRRLTAETFGTFALVFVAVGADTMAAVSGGRVSDAARAVAPALMVAALIYAIGDVSGAHLNPVVSLAFAFKRLVPVTWLVPYWVAQLAGAILACAAGAGTVRGRRPGRRLHAARPGWHGRRHRSGPDLAAGRRDPGDCRPAPHRRTRMRRWRSVRRSPCAG